MVEEIVFRKKPVLKLTDEAYPERRVQFGLFKARVILANLPAIQAFVNKYTNNTNNIDKNTPLEPI